jgi:hypothetical protein
MTNPNNPDVQVRLLNMAAEIVRNYAVDGIVFDDRLRYAGINADFSAVTRAQFEAYVGHPVAWPQDVFRYAIDYPSLSRSVMPGPLFESWTVFRAMTIRNFVASAVNAVRAVRSTATVSAYVGSWYPQYPELGANWAADDFSAGLRFLTPSFQQTGFAGLLDWMTTGCYYPAATISDAVSDGILAGNSVEAAGQFANRAANDQTWMYAGVALADYTGHPDMLLRALNAAAATTQGVMVFDLSQADAFWPVFTRAFATPAAAPSVVSGLLDQVRQQHAAHKASAALDPPVILYGGTPGTGL